MSTPLTVYSRPSCVQCTATYKALDKLGLDYKKIDVSADENALNFLLGQGYRQVPVVIDGDDSWSGFRPDLIKAAAARRAA